MSEKREEKKKARMPRPSAVEQPRGKYEMSDPSDEFPIRGFNKTASEYGIPHVRDSEYGIPHVKDDENDPSLPNS